MRRFIPLLTATTALCPSVAAADEPDREIVVTGAGLPERRAAPAYAAIELDADALARSSSGRLEDALAGVAGFQQFRRSDSRSANPSAQGVTLRSLGGNATSRTLVLLDGVPLADPFFGYIPFSSLAPERLGMARITRGGGGGAFGAGAVAGTIELTSTGAQDLALLEAQGLVNDRGDSELSASIAPRLGEGFAEVSGRWDRGRGFRTTPEAQRVPASVRARYDSWTAALRSVAPIAPDIEVQARIAAFDDARTLRFAGADSTARGQSASLRLVGRGPWQFDALAYVQAGNFSNVVVSSTTFRPTLDQYVTPTTGLGGKFEIRPPLGDGFGLRLGGDWRNATGETKETAFNATTGAVTARRRAGGTNRVIGIFAEGDVALGPAIITAGLRADRWTIADGHFVIAAASGAITADQRFPDRAGWETTARTGVLLTLAPALKLRAAAYTGFRLPTLNELYRPFAVFPVTTQANAALDNEKLRGIEAGFDFAPSTNVALMVTAFDNRLREAVANVTVGPNLRQRRNVAAVRARGVELGLRAGSPTLRFDGSLALTKARVEAGGTAAALDGRRPAQSPSISASGTVTWALRPGATLAFTLRHVGRQFEDDLETDVLPPATTLGFFAEAPLTRRLSLTLRGENLTDETVITRNQGGSIDLGAPRTIWAGLRLRLP